MQHDLSAYDRPADLHDGLRETFNISPAGSRIPPELLSEIVQDAGDWELASALRVRTQLKMSPPWMEQATLLDRAILTGDAGFVERVYDEGHTRFTQWGARILTRFAYTHILDYLLTVDPAQLSAQCASLLPAVASAWGRVSVLEWAIARGFKMRASPDAIDDASRHGHVAVLDWWRWRSGIDPLELAYSEHALSSATVKRQIDVLEWWLSPRAGGLPLKLPNVLDFASMSGERQILEWWLAKSQDKDLRRSRGVQAKYSRAAMYHLSCRGDTSLLEWWRTDSGLPLKYDKDVLTGATKHGRVHSLEWWRTSGLELEYRFFDVEEAIEDAVVGTDDVAAWWRERGFEQGRITMHDWMKVRKLR